jgi:hypothetical protein
MIRQNGYHVKQTAGRRSARLFAALEEIRREYNSWRYNAEQRLQRAYRIIKQT